MSSERIRQLLAELREEAKQTAIDDETRSSLRELDSDIHELLGSSTTEPARKHVLERAELLEAKFAVDHPAVERMIREVMDALVKIGV